jgi:pimeloyl-ACP methyl ester carboxylesterase
MEGADPAAPPRRGALQAISRHGYHRVAYTEWGDPASPHVVVCLHGLSRQGRDFDRLAAALAREGRRVLCPDLVGRGRSGWLRDPEG